MLHVGKKGLYFTPHAQMRMEQRGISEEQVQEAISSHHTVVPGNQDTRKYLATVNKNELVVVVEERSREYRIVSAFWR